MPLATYVLSLIVLMLPQILSRRMMRSGEPFTGNFPMYLELVSHTPTPICAVVFLSTNASNILPPHDDARMIGSRRTL
jgi:hypothetical protein